MSLPEGIPTVQDLTGKFAGKTLPLALVTSEEAAMAEPQLEGWIRTCLSMYVESIHPHKIYVSITCSFAVPKMIMHLW